MDEQKIRQIVQQEIQKSGSNGRFSQSPLQRHVHNGLDSPPINNDNVIKNIPVSGSITMAHVGIYTLGLANTPSTATQVFFNGVVTNAVDGVLTAASITVGHAGTGYTAGDIVSVTGGSLGKLTIDTVGGSGEATAVSVLTGGSGYTSDTNVVVTGGTGSGLWVDTTAATSSITIRAHCIGTANLAPSFYLQPSTSSTVNAGGPQQEIIQSSSMFLVDSTSTSYSVSGGAGGTVSVPIKAVRALVDEGHIVDVEYSGIKARATVLSYSKNTITVEVETLASGYQIVGNWVIT